MTKAPEELAYDRRLLRSRLLAGDDSWLARCADALTQDASPIAALSDSLENPRSSVHRALGEGGGLSWARPEPDRKPLADEVTPEQATAQMVATLAAVLHPTTPRTDEEITRAVTDAMAHCRRSGLQSVGGRVLSAEPLGAVTEPLARVLDEVTTQARTESGLSSRGFLTLLALELCGLRPETTTTSRVPVLFRSTASERSGTAGTLTLSLRAGGPRGIHPDPSQMAFLQADSAVAESIDAAWAAWDLDSSDDCVTWSVTGGHGRPILALRGESMAAAFAVALDDLRPGRGIRRHLRLRSLDRNCAVTAGLSGQSLTPVTGYEAKLQAARDMDLRVVVADGALENARSTAPADYADKVQGAQNLQEAIKATRSRLNRAVAGLTAAVVALVIGGTGGAVAWANQARADFEARTASEMAARAISLANSNPRIAALTALTADHLNSTPTTQEAMRVTMENNRFVSATRQISDSPIIHIAPLGDAVLTAAAGESVVRFWSRPDLEPAGESEVGGPVLGLGGAGYPDTGLAAALTSNELILFQARSASAPVEVARFDAPFADSSSRIMGPFVSEETNAVWAVDESFRGLYWRPGMDKPAQFDLADIEEGADLIDGKAVAATTFDNLPYPTSPSEASVEQGQAVIATDNGRLLELHVELPTTDDTPQFRLERASYTPIEGVIQTVINAGNTGILVGTSDGITQRNLRSDGIDLGGAIREPVLGLAQLDGIVAVTPTGLRHIAARLDTKMNNVGSSPSRTSQIQSMAVTVENALLVGGGDGRISVVDPEGSLTELNPRFGAMDARFTPAGELVYAGVRERSSVAFRSVTVETLSLEDELEIERSQHELVVRQRESPVETFSVPRELHRQVFSVDATESWVVAAGHEDAGKSEASVWLWPRKGGDEDAFENPRTLLPTSPAQLYPDIAAEVAITPDGSRVTALLPSRRELTSWEPSTGEVLWSVEIPVHSLDGPYQWPTTTFDHDRGTALLHSNDENGQVTLLVDLNTGELTPAPWAQEYGSTWLSPDGTTVAAIGNQSVTILSLSGQVLAGPQPVGTDITGAAWQADGEVLSLITGGGSEIFFLDKDTLEASAPPWQITGLEGNSLARAPVWSPNGEFLAFATVEPTADGPWRTGELRVFAASMLDPHRALCQVAGSDWTDAEWREHVEASVKRVEVC